MSCQETTKNLFNIIKYTCDDNVTSCDNASHIRKYFDKLTTGINTAMWHYGERYWGSLRQRIASSFRHRLLLNKNMTEFELFQNETRDEIIKRRSGINSAGKKLEDMLEITYSPRLGYRRRPKQIITGNVRMCQTSRPVKNRILVVCLLYGMHLCLEKTVEHLDWVHGLHV